jgi:hypothetical protein
VHKKPVSIARLTELRIHVEFWKTITVMNCRVRVKWITVEGGGQASAAMYPGRLMVW